LRRSTFLIVTGLLGLAGGTFLGFGCGGSLGAAGASGTAGGGGGSGTAGATGAAGVLGGAAGAAGSTAGAVGSSTAGAAGGASGSGGASTRAGGGGGGGNAGAAGSAGVAGSVGGAAAGQGGNAGGVGGGDGAAGSTVDSGVGASLTIDPKEAPFFIGLGQPTPPVVFTVTNVGSAPSGTFTVAITGSSTFKITSTSCDKPLPAGESCQVAVVFDAPGGAGGRTASLHIAADGIPGGQFIVALLGDAA
jgi:hypothetical protein